MLRFDNSLGMIYFIVKIALSNFYVMVKSLNKPYE